MKNAAIFSTLLPLFLALLFGACTNPTPPPYDGSAGAGGLGGGVGGSGGAPYVTCPQHRVEGIECPSPTDATAVLHKGGLRCASCTGVDSSGTPTVQPVACTTIAGGDLCVADCGECS